MSGELAGVYAAKFPGLGGDYGWYRLKVRVDAAGGPLWLKMPDAHDDASQV